MNKGTSMNTYTVRGTDLKTNKKIRFEVQAETYTKAQDFVRNEYLQFMKVRQEWILINKIELNS